MKHHDESGRQERRRKKKAAWRMARLATRPPPGQRWCRGCIAARDLSAFARADDRYFALCTSCRTSHRRWSLANPGHAAERLRIHRSENRDLIQERTKNFMATRPGLMRVFKLRQYADNIWLYGPPQGRRYLTGAGYTYRDSCQECGATDPAPFAFWASYAKALHFTKLCPHHHRLRVERGSRCEEQTHAELQRAVLEIDRIRRDLRALGITSPKIEMLKKLAKR